MQLPSILFLLSLCLPFLTQQIIDYSHTASIQRTQRDSSKTYDISITPSLPTTESFEFPQACWRTNELSTNQLMESDKLPLGSHEEMLNKLKRNMTRLLSLSEDIKLLRLEIAEIEKELPRKSEREPLSGGQVDELSQLEENLLSINATIEQKVRGLGELIAQELNRTKNNGFSELRLGFELSLYEARLRYLQDLRKNHKGEKDNNSDVKISDYFNLIQKEAKAENKQLGDLYDLLNNFASNSALKLKISNQLKKLQAKNYIIEDKQACRINNHRPINQHNEHSIDEITAQLRILKKIQSPNREHCEGVALKLLNQIKKVLRAYNYSHVCAQGLEELKEQKKKIELKLAALYNQYNTVEYDPIFKKIQQYFNKSIEDKDKLITEVFTFTFSQHNLNVPALQTEISQTVAKIHKIKHQIEHPPSQNSKPFDHEAVGNKIKEINEQQFKYCSIKEDYEAKYRVLERLVRNYEFKVEQSIQKNTFFLEKMERLRKVQGEFNYIRKFLLLAIE